MKKKMDSRTEFASNKGLGSRAIIMAKKMFKKNLIKIEREAKHKRLLKTENKMRVTGRELSWDGH